MKMTRLRMLLPLLIGSWGCASTPPVFRADSAANPDAPEARRFPVATILAAKDPLAASVCPESGPCVATPAKPEVPTSSEHQHHHHH